MNRLASILLFLAFAAPVFAQDRYAPLIDGILAAWNVADVVCLGEGHARKKDSDLRLSLVRDPRFVRRVRAVVVEMANGTYQPVLDRFILDGAAMSRDELSVVWRNATAAEVWESPIYEEFLRAIREVNLALPRDQRVRVIAGDTAIDWQTVTTAEQLASLMKSGQLNRGGNIRDLIAQQVLDKDIKALAIYGSGHCLNVGMGFPGELASKYPSRMWSVSGFLGEEGARTGREVFGLGDNPAYVVVRGTKYAQLPANAMFVGRPTLTVGNSVDAIVWYGDTSDPVVRADLTELQRKYGAELARRARLMKEATKLAR